MIYLEANKTKKRAGRPVPLSPNTVNFLCRLFKENRVLETRGNTAVFISVSGRRLQYSDARDALISCGKRAGITSMSVSPHKLRHSFAKHYILNGGDPFTLQKILGHSTIEMTKRYIALKVEDLKAQHVKFSPMNEM